MLRKRKAFHISSSLKEGLEDTIKAAENYSGQLRVEVIPLRKIELDPDNPRELSLTLEELPQGPNQQDPLYEKKGKEKESLESMSISVKNEGVINPVVVYKKGDKYRLIAGERRTLASKLAGKEDIPAKILNEKPSDLKLSLLQWIENSEREDLTLWERLRNLEKIISQVSQTSIPPMKLKELIGCSLSQAINYVSVLYANEDIRQAIQENKLKNLEKAALISKIEDHELQKTVLAASIRGASFNEIKTMATMQRKNVIEKVAPLKKSGRQAQTITLGNTKNVEVVKWLMNTIVNHSPYRELRHTVETLNWSDFSSVSRAFNQLIKGLEEKII